LSTPVILRSAATADGSVFARVHAPVLCDEVEELPGEEVLFNLNGVCTQVQALSFPYVLPQLCVYLQVTGHEGEASGHQVLVQETTEEEILRLPIEGFHLAGPLEIVPVWLWVKDCEFPEPGVSWFQVFLNEKLVAERRFHAITISGDANGQPTR
jgi:hypothetical protein